MHMITNNIILFYQVIYLEYGISWYDIMIIIFKGKEL